MATEKTMHFALLDNNLADDGSSFLFRDPLQFITATHPQDVKTAIMAIERETQAGRYACGYIAYEAAQAYGFSSDNSSDLAYPLLCFGIFDRRETLTNTQVDAFLTGLAQDGCGYHLELSLQTELPDYDDAFDRIRAELTAGNSYQVNHTMRYQGGFGGCDIALYQALREAQKVEYGALLHFPETRVLSRSPELFFRKDGTHLVTKPMKGTAERHADPHQDNLAKEGLIASEKQRAENVMIVDLLRNDMGKIAKAGSVSVEALFDVETYQTLHQMTSTITCEIATAHVSLSAMMAALFPCGSITGAPKLRTSQIIAQTETGPRGIYTGAIGACGPNGEMAFSVAIRTLTIDQKRRANFGVGSGIVIDSEAGEEFEECKIKAKFLTDNASNIDIIETFKWTPDQGPINLDLHMQRLGTTCHRLGFHLPDEALTAAIRGLTSSLAQASKIRIAYSRDGKFTLSHTALGGNAEGVQQVALSTVRVDSTDPLRQMKTTARGCLDSQRVAYQKTLGVYDVLFANEHGHLTEASYHSVFLRFGEVYHTPRLQDGVLDGVGRKLFIQKHGANIVQRALPIAALDTADAVILVSSVRGVVPVEVLGRG